MKKKPSSYFLAILVLLLVPEYAWSASPGTETSPIGILVSLLTIGLALVCFYFALRIHSFLKKGELALSWQLWGLSFLFLGLAQLLEIVAHSGFIPLASASVQITRLLALGLMVFGLHRATKILS